MSLETPLTICGTSQGEPGSIVSIYILNPYNHITTSWKPKHFIFLTHVSSVHYMCLKYLRAPF
jgi:hypothetical protein